MSTRWKERVENGLGDAFHEGSAQHEAPFGKMAGRGEPSQAFTIASKGG